MMNDIKKIMIRMFCALILSPCVFCSSIYAFGNPTHGWLTEVACGSVNIIDHIDAREYECLKKACNIPDEEENDNLWWGHFYEFESELSDMSKDSSMSRMNRHFQSAKKRWQENRRMEALDELGRSIHYMQDMCCIVHLLGRAPWHLLIHQNYEHTLDALAASYVMRILRSPSASFNFRVSAGVPIVGVANSYVIKVLEQHGQIEGMNIWPMFSKLFTPSFLVGISNPHLDEKFRATAERAAPFEDFEMAYQATCELIYLFFRDVGINL